MKTYSIKKDEIHKNWILIDAKNAVLGRLAVISANTLRGKNKPNYDPESIKTTSNILIEKNLDPKIVIDMSHGNSKKIHSNQIIVCESICSQINKGDSNILGVMVESNIKSGKQKLVNKQNLEWGVSITDACIDLDETILLIEKLYESLKIRFRKRKNAEI